MPVFVQYNLFGANVYMCYDYVHLDNLSYISAYRNHNVLMCPVPNQLQSCGVSPCIVTHSQALHSVYCVGDSVCCYLSPLDGVVGGGVLVREDGREGAGVVVLLVEGHGHKLRPQSLHRRVPMVITGQRNMV